jgi:sarcosine oxidase subunit delta
MLLITCPSCGVEAEETEFAPGGEAHIVRADVASTDDDFATYLFDRKNPRGVHFERWRHAFGCGKWFHMARHTHTLEIFGTYAADETTPPQAILDRISERTEA